jgi:hypothetical protein
VVKGMAAQAEEAPDDNVPLGHYFGSGLLGWTDEGRAVLQTATGLVTTQEPLERRTLPGQEGAVAVVAHSLEEAVFLLDSNFDAVAVVAGQATIDGWLQRWPETGLHRIEFDETGVPVAIPYYDASTKDTFVLHVDRLGYVARRIDLENGDVLFVWTLSERDPELA